MKPKPTLNRHPRPPRQKAGTIQVRWAATRDNAPDWFVSWGAPSDSPTARLCCSAIADLGNELQRRGYDPRTLRFTVSKPTGKDTP